MNKLTIPELSQLTDAAVNAYEKFSGGGIADLRPMPRSLVDNGPTRSLYRFEAQLTALSGEPVLLVPPLAAPALCFDLRRGCSVAEHLVNAGRRTYLLDYGAISFTDRTLGVEHWVDEVLPKALQKVSSECGGAPVHLVGWSLGGIFSLLTAAAHAQLPIASVSAIASPIDVTQIPMIAPVRPLVSWANGKPLTLAYRLVGHAPKSLVRRAYKLMGAEKYLTKPIAIATNLADRDYLAQIEAVDHFMANMIAYPGRTFGQLFHHVLRANNLAEGQIILRDSVLHLSNISVPTLLIAGRNDGIAPRGAVEKTVELLTGAPHVRFELCPGGHLGVLTGRAARVSTWRVLDDFLDRQC